MIYQKKISAIALIAAVSIFVGCQEKFIENKPTSVNADVVTEEATTEAPPFLNEPLVHHMYTADPSAHVFNGKIYIYPSHDVANNLGHAGGGDRFDMRDYHVFSLARTDGDITDHGVALHIDDVPWASRQMWAPDAAEKDGQYFLYFPAKDKQGIFRIGVATSDSPSGPFNAEPEPIPQSHSIDPSVFKDTDGVYYMYIGGIWGGQLQRWTTGKYVAEDAYPADNEPAIAPKVARMSDDMLTFAEDLREIRILDKDGNPIPMGDNTRRFFEAAWIHKYNGKYYFSYSTGDTHYIAYATGDSPYGPFTYQGIILEPVLGWTNHHSIVEFEGSWYLFYHDSQLSGGQSHLRNIKMTKLIHLADGSIEKINAYFK